MKKWVLAGWIALLLLIPGWALAQMELVTENDAFNLLLDQDTMNFCVESKESGRRMYAFPEAWEEDAFAKGNNKKLIGSLVAIQMYNDKNVSRTVNSRAGCMEDGTFAYAMQEDGFDVQLNFAEQMVEIRLEIRLTDEGFEARVPLDGIRQTGEDMLGSITILPFLNAGRMSDDGYIFLPDGCGTLIDYGTSFGLTSRVTRTIYGRDLSIMYATLPMPEATASLPVYGLKTNDVAFLAVIEEGEYTSQIEAAVAEDNAEYYRVSPTLVYRELHNIVLFENTTEERTVTSLSLNPVAEGLALEVFFLEGEDATYSGMARAYREYLLREGGLHQADTTPYVDIRLFGAAEQSTLTLGVPHTVLHSFTTFEQAQVIAQEALDAGVGNMNLLLYGFHSGGRNAHWTGTLSPEKQLGGADGLNGLLEYAQGAPVDVTVVAEMVRVYRNGAGFRGANDAAHSISDGIAYQYTPNLINQKRDYTKEPYMLLAPELLPEKWDDYEASALEQGVGSVMVENWGTNVYSQYALDRFMTRDQAGTLWESALDDSRVEIVADGGNAYALRVADRLVNISETDSDLDMTTREIPFYQMVVHGFLPYSGTPGNHVANSRDMFLKLMEYGAYPCYEWFYAPSRDTQYTCLDDVFSGHYSAWLDQAAQEYAACLALYNATEGSPIVEHERLMPEVFRVTYENGVRCYVNYGEEAARVDGVVVPGLDYVLEGV